MCFKCDFRIIKLLEKYITYDIEKLEGGRRALHREMNFIREKNGELERFLKGRKMAEIEEKV